MSVFTANTAVLDVTGLRAELSGTAINDATCTVTIRDANGVVVAGASWPLTMSYVAASDGNYRAFLPASLPLVAKESYTAYIDPDGGFNRTGHWELHFKPITRSVSDT